MSYKDPVYYDDINRYAMNEVSSFLAEEFGGDEPGKGMIAHELESEYVHTDIRVIEPEDDIRTFATFGMGARETFSPLPQYKRVELVMQAAPRGEYEPDSTQLVICSELQNISKYPFRNYTWLGPGHTINASQKFKETFGYDFFLFVQYHHSLEVRGVGEVSFLMVVPVYEDERNWMASHENGSLKWTEYYLKSCDDDEPIGLVDVSREHIIPA